MYVTAVPRRRALTDAGSGAKFMYCTGSSNDLNNLRFKQTATQLHM